MMQLRVAAGCLLAGSLLIGIAQVALLPPWEGFDETAHYSYLQQLSKSGAWPRFGDRLSGEVEASLKVLPSASSVSSYRDFFASPAPAIASARAALEASREKDRPWRAGEAVNWQAQHPPIYYALLVPLYHLSEAWSLERQLLLLRGASYLMAWLALCSAILFAYLRTGTAAAVLAPALWPMIFPMWFPEMARLGNDSLVALWVAAAAIALTRVSAAHVRLRHYAFAGLCCGLGLLTKATFLPLAGVATLWLVWRAWRGRAQWSGVIVFAAVTAALSGWWYVGKLIETGALTGLHDIAILQQSGGLLRHLPHFENPIPVGRIVQNMINSFVWTGTWTFLLPPLATMAPLLLLAAMLAGAYLVQAAKGRVRGPDWLAPLTLAVFLTGVVYHSAILIMVYGNAGFTLWYLHAYAALMAPMVGIGFALLMSRRYVRLLTAALLIYPLAFLPIAFCTLTLFYAGCGVKREGTTYFDFSSAAPCATDVRKIYENLSALSEPGLFAVLFAAGWLLAAAGIVGAVRSLRQSSSAPSW